MKWCLFQLIAQFSLGGRPGIYVKGITEGSAAAVQGRIQVNDQIVGVCISAFVLIIVYHTCQRADFFGLCIVTCFNYYHIIQFSDSTLGLYFNYYHVMQVGN